MLNIRYSQYRIVMIPFFPFGLVLFFKKKTLSFSLSIKLANKNRKYIHPSGAIFWASFLFILRSITFPVTRLPFREMSLVERIFLIFWWEKIIRWWK